ncbi:MAG: hypothetical protein AAF609_05520 [Cyanobacteria bacterium P01_C01_bin.120]
MPWVPPTPFEPQNREEDVFHGLSGTDVLYGGSDEVFHGQGGTDYLILGSDYEVSLPDRKLIDGSETNPASLELEIDIPDDLPPEKVRELVQQAALAADAVHRSNGGSGLTIDTVEVFEDSRVPEGSRQ